MSIDSSEFPPTIHAEIINNETLPGLEQWAMAQTLRFSPEIIAQERWKEMVDATQQDGKERGLIIGLDRGKLIKSKIFIGTEQDISSPALPYGLRTFSPFMNDIVNIHTHPMAENLKIATTIFSDLDINKFLGSALKALIVLDSGGVHMLTRSPYSSHFTDSEQGDKPIAILNGAVKTARENTGLIAEARLEMAKKIKPLGISYYFSPSLDLTSNDLVELTKA